MFDNVPSDFVEEYLERTFYNLTAVSLHDAHTYTKMAMMAHFRHDFLIIFLILGRSLSIGILLLVVLIVPLADTASIPSMVVSLIRLSIRDWM